MTTASRDPAAVSSGLLARRFERKVPLGFFFFLSGVLGFFFLVFCWCFG